MSSSHQVPLVLLLLLVPSLARADGIAFDLSSKRPLAEREQRAAISYHDGIERMIIAINFELEDADASLWIFPVPGTPERTKIDVLDSFPRFSGSDPRKSAANGVDGLMALTRATQLWPLIFDAVWTFRLSKASRGVSQLMRVEKYGVHAEAVTADSLDTLGAFLRQKKVTISTEQLAGFGPYFSGSYVFVVAWIASRDQLRKEFPQYEELWGFGRKRWPCLYIEFPTDKAFYPLRPTRSYGKENIPVRLFVLGFVQPQTDPAIANRLEVSYGVQPNFSQETPRQFTEGFTAERVEYTEIGLTIPAREFSDDLWFTPWSPSGIKYAFFLESLDDRAVLAGWTLAVAALSYISAGIAAWSLFGTWKGYATFGLMNLLTLAGLLLFVRFARGHTAENLRKEKRKFWHRFTLIFVSLTVLVQIALRVPLMSH